jgi:hypothetical protein
MNMTLKTQAGRSCPLHYRYKPSVFASDAPERLAQLDVLYVVGGLYGNEAALQRVIDLFARETGRARLVFNGDFHWFDADSAVFARVQHSVLQFDALRGNVETELADENAKDDAGCGCAYPDWVSDDVVERSNRIHQALRRCTTPEQRRALGTLPMWLRADVGALRFGLVHGDPQSLAGWGFAQEHLRDAAHRAQVAHWLDEAQVDAFASTHTCLPVFQQLAPGAAAHGSSARWVFNNGAAGMPNFQGDAAGLITRVALSPFSGPERRFGVTERGVHIDAIAIETDSAAWQQQFKKIWPEGSDAHASYFNRIQHGPAYQPREAVRFQEN